MNYRERYKSKTGLNPVVIGNSYRDVTNHYAQWLESQLQVKDELVKAQEKYINHYEENAMYHSERTFNKGQKLRQKIEQLKTKAV